MKKQKRTKLRKVFLVGCVTVTAIVFAVFAWFVVSLFSEPNMTKLPAHYPFRSESKKNQYLKYYDTRAKKWPVRSDTLTIQTSYGKTFLRVSGPKEALPLVLLPSTSASSLIWLPNIKTLSEKYRVYAVDNIYDFGRSVNTRPIKCPEDMVNWLDELFTILALGDSINLVGLSFGGWLTSQYALHFPNRLCKSVWLAPAATIFQLPGEWAWRGILSAIPHRFFMRKFMVEWLFEDLLKKEDDYSQTLLKETIDDAMMGLKCFKLRMPVTPTVLEDDELQSLTVPTLFLVGENEKLYSAQEAVKRINGLAPKIETEIIPNAGHDLTIVQAELVNKKILEFLEQPRLK
jgi:pimeloyl-ACP methyl ester carboxylesterase